MSIISITVQSTLLKYFTAILIIVSFKEENYEAKSYVFSLYKLNIKLYFL